MSEEKFVGQFLCTISMVMIICAEFITEKSSISRYLEKDRKGIIYNIMMSIFMIIFAIPIFIFTRYSKIG